MPAAEVPAAPAAADYVPALDLERGLIAPPSVELDAPWPPALGAAMAPHVADPHADPHAAEHAGWEAQSATHAHGAQFEMSAEGYEEHPMAGHDEVHDPAAAWPDDPAGHVTQTDAGYEQDNRHDHRHEHEDGNEHEHGNDGIGEAFDPAAWHADAAESHAESGQEATPDYGNAGVAVAAPPMEQPVQHVETASPPPAAANRPFSKPTAGRATATGPAAARKGAPLAAILLPILLMAVVASGGLLWWVMQPKATQKQLEGEWALTCNLPDGPVSGHVQLDHDGKFVLTLLEADGSTRGGMHGSWEVDGRTLRLGIEGDSGVNPWGRAIVWKFSSVETSKIGLKGDGGVATLEKQ